MLIAFPTPEDDKNGFAALCVTEDKFFCLGKRTYQINERQKNALDLLEIPYEVIK